MRFDDLKFRGRGGGSNSRPRVGRRKEEESRGAKGQMKEKGEEEGRHCGGFGAPPARYHRLCIDLYA